MAACVLWACDYLPFNGQRVQTLLAQLHLYLERSSHDDHAAPCRATSPGSASRSGSRRLQRRFSRRADLVRQMMLSIVCGANECTDWFIKINHGHTGQIEFNNVELIETVVTWPRANRLYRLIDRIELCGNSILNSDVRAEHKHVPKNILRNGRHSGRLRPREHVPTADW